MITNYDMRYVLFLFVLYIIGVSSYEIYNESFKNWENITILIASILLMVSLQMVHIFNA
jgi:hypothetical protein